MYDLIRGLWYSLHRTETVTVYKVVMQSKYKSVIAYGKAEVEYGVGEWITAPNWLSKKGYDLLCFGSLEEARACIRQWWSKLNVAIWEASAKGIKSNYLPPICGTCSLSEGHFYISPNSVWPEGTIMAKAVRLEEKVWDSEESS